MLELKRKILSGAAASALLLNLLTPLAYADTNLVISGNGAESRNTADVVNTTTTTVVQNNTADIRNNVSSVADSGGNDANGNTGGDVVVDTGNASNEVKLSTQVNLNQASVNDNNHDSDADVVIAGNGFDSRNDVNLISEQDTSVFQDNNADIRNNVVADSRTGNNDANRNTGGDVVVITGHAETDVEVKNAANANMARVDNGSGSSRGDLDVEIVGNGAFSRNDVDLDLSHFVSLVQNNDARVVNDIVAFAESGLNDANDNTGGDVAVKSGDTRSRVEIDNMANFNAAEIDCCTFDISGEISGNGFDSRNDLIASILDDLSVFQDLNDLVLRNDPIADAFSGDNDANRNTGSVFGSDDMAVVSGHAESETVIKNSGNVNMFGSDDHMDLDLSDFDMDFDFHFDLSDLMSLLSHHMI